MKKLNYIIVLFSIFLAVGCYEDKGNYTYTDTGIVKSIITGGLTVMYGDTLKIEPKFEVEGNIDTLNDLTYQWTLTDKDKSKEEPIVLSNEKNIFIPIFKENIGQYNLTFSAENKSTGVKSFAYCDLVVDNGLSRAYLLLTKNSNNEYDIDGLSHPYGIIKKSQYSIMNGKKLQNIDKLIYLNSDFVKNDHLFALSKNDCIQMSTIDLTYHCNIDELFFEKPNTLNMSDVIGNASGENYFVINNGQLHKISNAKNPFKASLTLALDDLGYDIKGVGKMSKNDGRGTFAFYDEKNNRFLTWYSTWNGAYLTTLYGNGVFNPLAIPENLTFFKAINGKKDRSYMLFKDENNYLYLYGFKNTGPYYRIDWTPYIAQKINAEDASRMLDSKSFESLKTEDRIYYCYGNKIFLYNINDNVSEIFYETENPNAIFSKVYYRDIHEQEVTAASNVNGEGTFYRFMVNYLGKIMEPTEKVPETMITFSGFDEISNFTFKYKTN